VKETEGEEGGGGGGGGQLPYETMGSHGKLQAATILIREFVIFLMLTSLWLTERVGFIKLNFPPGNFKSSSGITLFHGGLHSFIKP
jgi:hypothetical protein